MSRPGARRRLEAIGLLVFMLIAPRLWGGAARAQATFTLGSTASDVRRAQGIPSVIERLHSLGLEIWTFGAATVRLSSDSLRVVGWEDDARRTLHARIDAGPNATSATTFGAGSHRDDVARLMGTPIAVREDRAHGTMRWRYGASTISIGMTDGRVVGWANASGNLRVQPAAVASGTTKSGSPSAPRPNAPVLIECVGGVS